MYVPFTGSTKPDLPDKPQGVPDISEKSQGEPPVVSNIYDHQGYVPFSSGALRVKYEHDYGYWERPENIAAHYDAIKANPNLDWRSMGIDPDFVNLAYGYLKQYNAGRSYWEWKPLDKNDPFSELMRSLPEPDESVQWHGVYKPDYLKPVLHVESPSVEDFNNLTGWQKVMATVMGSGALQGAMNMLPVAIAATIAGGPLAGAGALAVGAGLGLIGDPDAQEAGRKKLSELGLSDDAIDFVFKAINTPLRVLNLPSEWAEQALGTAYQIGASGLPVLGYQLGLGGSYDEYLKRNKELQEVIDNLGAVWEASKLTYEAASTSALGSVVSGLPAGIEWVLDNLSQGESDVDFAKVGEVYTLTGGPVKLDVYGAAILSAARNELLAGKDPNLVFEKYRAMTGFSGQWTDLWGQTALDPLNLMPRLGRGVADITAKVTHDHILAKAVSFAETTGGGAVDVMRAYREGIRQAPLESLSKVQKLIGGVSDVGIFKELQTESKLTPASFFHFQRNLDPKSKALMSNELVASNMKDLVLSAGRFEDALDNVEALMDMKPGEAAAGAKLVGTPELYTAQRSVVIARPEVEAIKSRWSMTAKSRNFLTRASALVEESPYKILDDLLNDGEREAQALHSRIIDKLMQADPDHPVLKDPTFTPEAILSHAELFRNNKWAISDDYARAHLYNRLIDKAADYHVKAFGVQPEGVIGQLGKTSKAVQSLLLLSYNPAYLVNNVINNVVTLVASGVRNLFPSGKLFQDIFGGEKYQGATGMVGEPVGQKARYVNLDEAFELGGLEAVIEFGKQSANAKITEQGVLQKVRDLIQKVPQPMTKASAALEDFQSNVAIRSTALRVWNREWSVKELSQFLVENNVDPSLAKVLAECKTEADIDRVLSGDKDYTSRSFIHDVAVKMGHDPAMLADMFDQLGITDKMDDYISKGLDPFQAVEAIKQDVNQVLKDTEAERRKAAIERGAVMMRGEGFAAGVDALYDMLWDHDQFWTQSFRANELAFAEANKLDPVERRAFLNQHFQNQNQAWRERFEADEAVWEGFLKEAGFDLSLSAKKFMGELIDNHRRWGQFYAERERAIKRFFKESKNATPEESARAWRATQEEISIMYEHFANLELESIKRQGAAFLEMWREQMGLEGIEGVAHWWKGVYETTQMRQALMKDMRAWERGLEPQLPEVREVLLAFSPKDLAWQPFLEKVYLPAIGRITHAYLDGVKALSDAATGKSVEGGLEFFSDLFSLSPEEQAIAAVKLSEIELGKKVDDWMQEIEHPEIAELLRKANENRLEPYSTYSEIPFDERLALEGFSVRRNLEPFDVNGTPVVGGIYKGDELIAYIPDRFEGKVFDTDHGPARILGIDPDGNWVYRMEDGEIKKITDGDADPPVIGPYLPGTLAESGAIQPDIAKATLEGFETFVEPALYELARQMKYSKPVLPEINITPQVVRQLKARMREVKKMALKYGQMQRDFALLDYNRRSVVDRLLDQVFPYQFWFTRTMLNTSLRFLDRPAQLAFFARLSQFTDDEYDKVIPSRLKGKLRIPVPFLNSIAPWAGGALYIDPWGKLFPAREFVRPVENYLATKNRVNRKAEQLIQEWVENGDVDADEAKKAIDSMSGHVWEKAVAIAGQEEGADIIDMMSLLSSPSLALSLVVRGPERVGPLPMSRLIQGLSAVTGVKGFEKLDLEAQWRKSAGLSEFGEWGNYYIDRQLANLAADGEFTPEEVIQAMIDREGPAFDAAVERVRLELAMRQPGMLPFLAARNALTGDGNILDILGAAVIGLLPGGLLPEGELKMRGLKEEFDAAWRAKHSGENPNALNEFFDNHPEYKARLALYAEPEDRLKQFMISEVWERYEKLPDIVKGEALRELGEDFTENFLNADTRNYDAIPVGKLVEWAQKLGSDYQPKGYPTYDKLHFEDAANLYQQQKDALFPNIDAVKALYYRAKENGMNLKMPPELAKYFAWEANFLANNPELIQYVNPELVESAGLDVAQMVYLYRAERARLFGADIISLQNEYYSLPKQERAAFLKQHPQLRDYWDWSRDFKKQFPEVGPYLSNDKRYKEALTNLTPEAQLALMNYFVKGEPLGNGVRQYLYLMWEREGGKGSFSEWLDSLGVFYGR